MIKGKCLCGDIRFETSVKPQGVSMCHCGQCRRQSGGIWSSANVPVEALTINGEVNLYASSDFAKRGSCAKCGTFLFWKANDGDHIAFSLGAVEGPTGLKLSKHIFVEDKGDYYDIADGLPQFQRS